MPLTDVRIRQSKPAAKPYRVTDGGGLFIEVRPNGSKLWRYAYRIARKQNMFAIGAYPEMSLQDARTAHDKARALVRDGIHPSRDRAQARDAQAADNKNTFKPIANEWYKRKLPKWTEGTASQARAILDNDILPTLGNRPMRSITSAEILKILNSIVDRKAPTIAIVARQIISQVFIYAVITLRAEHDPAHPLKGAVVRPEIQNADAKDREQIRDLLSRLKNYQGNRITVIAMRLLLMLFIRTGELRNAPWCELDFDLDIDNPVWIIPAERMKKRRKHMVPLPRQAVVLIKELKEITGNNKHLFPNHRDPKLVMSSTTINRMLQYLGYPSGYFTGHDFRATASTLLHEMGYRESIVEMQLAHAKRNKVAAAYNHAKYLPDRTAMMQDWADWLEAAENDSTPIRRGKPEDRRAP